MSKNFKIPFNHLLVKIDQVKYQTPCKEYIIEYTNFGYIDDVNWVAKRDNLYVTYAETLSDLMVNLVDKNPFMNTELYEILYGVEKED